MRPVRIAPSVMCCDFLDLRRQMDVFEAEKIDYLHLDVMDGHFVPNLALGADLIRQLKTSVKIPLDLHLMTERPELLLDLFPFGEGDIVSVHAESTVHLQRVLQAVRDRGARPFVALNPATPLSFAETVTRDLDGILVMTVNPGFAGQKMVPGGLEKIAAARALLDRCGREDAWVEADGNVSFENAPKMRRAGAELLGGGTSSIFRGDLARNIRAFRALLNGEDPETEAARG